MVKSLRIGIDFDNTIICYDDVFNLVALEQKLIPDDLSRGKGYVRDYLRKMDKEEEWIELQGIVYGSRLSDAYMFEGAAEFFQYCEKQRVDYFIISHKTIHPYSGHPYNLHNAAHRWIEQENIKCGVYFELTKEDKIRRISKLRCTHFIDDLPEFLSLPGFDKGLVKILFDPHKKHNNRMEGAVNVVNSWHNLLYKLKRSEF